MKNVMQWVEILRFTQNDKGGQDDKGAGIDFHQSDEWARWGIGRPRFFVSLRMTRGGTGWQGGRDSAMRSMDDKGDGDSAMRSMGS